MPEKDRVIFHIDCDAYFASVEEIYHPELKKVPMAICGDPKNRRGIVLAKNQLAKGFGVKTAEPIGAARQKCPDLVLVPPRRKDYEKYCEIVNNIYGQYTDMIERAGIDESYLDVTGTLHLFGSNALTLAKEIQERVRRETGLTVSVGISFNKIFAKLASDIKKPCGISLVSRENYKSVVWPMPVSALLMVGKATEQDLGRMYIRTIGDLAAASEDSLRRRLGKIGEQLHLYANGLDESPVLPVDDIHSIGNGLTFRRNLTSRDDVKTAVMFLSDSVARRMRRAGVKCITVQVTIKDANLKVITRQKAAAAPTWLAADLARESISLIEASWRIGVPIRMLTVTALKLVPAEEATEQLSLFSGPDESESTGKRERLEKTLDGIRDRYGSGSISSGAIVNNDLGIGDDYGQGKQDDIPTKTKP